jgi:hypothetical protein
MKPNFWVNNMTEELQLIRGSTICVLVVTEHRAPLSWLRQLTEGQLLITAVHPDDDGMKLVRGRTVVTVILDGMTLDELKARNPKLAGALARTLVTLHGKFVSLPVFGD